MSLPKLIAMLAVPGAQMLDVAGPLDVFAEANAQLGSSFYSLAVIAAGPGKQITTSSGQRILADHSLGQADALAIDTLLVAGAPQIATMRLRPGLAAWLATTAARCRRYGSVCTGTFLLGQADLLKGRRVTTHWAVADLLEQRHPEARVERDSLCVFDGALRTAAGVTAGLDLAIALVEEDLGAEVARNVAAQLVMYFKRGGGQLQFSRKGLAAPIGRSALQEVQRWVATHPGERHAVQDLAARTGMSPRHFARVFHAETGSTPASFVETTRVDAACRLLEDGALALKQIAVACGFSDPDALRRAFHRRRGVTPREYRLRHAVR